MWFSRFFVWALVNGKSWHDGKSPETAEIYALRQELAHLKDQLAHCAEGLKACQGSIAEASRRSEESGDIMWKVTSGDCTLNDGCLFSPNYPQDLPCLQQMRDRCHSTVEWLLSTRMGIWTVTHTSTSTVLAVGRHLSLICLVLCRRRQLPGRRPTVAQSGVITATIFGKSAERRPSPFGPSRLETVSLTTWVAWLRFLPSQCSRW